MGGEERNKGRKREYMGMQREEKERKQNSMGGGGIISNGVRFS